MLNKANTYIYKIFSNIFFSFEEESSSINQNHLYIYESKAILERNLVKFSMDDILT